MTISKSQTSPDSHLVSLFYGVRVFLFGLQPSAFSLQPSTFNLILKAMQIITTHKNTDFDALASVIAATMLYPGAIPVLPGKLNPNVRAFLSIHKDLFRIYSAGEIDLHTVDSLIVVDVNRWDRIAGVKQLARRKDLEIILWDHHSGAGDIAPDWQCREPMGANITLMVRQLKARRMILTTDSGHSFSHGAV